LSQTKNATSNEKKRFNVRGINLLQKFDYIGNLFVKKQIGSFQGFRSHFLQDSQEEKKSNLQQI